jgi:hypothetical protein
MNIKSQAKLNNENDTFAFLINSTIKKMEGEISSIGNSSYNLFSPQVNQMLDSIEENESFIQKYNLNNKEYDEYLQSEIEKENFSKTHYENNKLSTNELNLKSTIKII